MTVSNSWLVNVNVAISTTVLSTPAFNNCMLIGVMPTQSSPYQCPPASWGTDGYYLYSDLTTFNTDFTTLLNAALFAGDILQANRFQWLLDAGQAFFAQTPTPPYLYVSALAPQTPATNYTTFLSNLTAVQNSWYATSICDLVQPDAYSICIVQITATGAGTIPKGTVVTPMTATDSYELLQDYDIPGAGTYLLPFYSADATTSIPISTFTAISPSQSFVSGVTNLTAGNVGIPGVSTATKGINAALIALRSANNQKKFFYEARHSGQAETLQAEGGNQDLAVFYHSRNLESHNTTGTRASLAAAAMSRYFTDLFSIGVGMKTISSMQIQGQPVDPTIQTSNIGTPGQAGSGSNLIGWNNNVYAGFGTQQSNIGLIQYGYMSNSTPTTQVYLDQVVGADYVQAVAQADLATYIINQQPVGGIPYNDAGIQQIVNVFKGSIQKAVNQNILQAPSNSSFTYLTLAQVESQYPNNIANRIYNTMYFNGQFLSRIQRIGVNVNLTL